MYKIIINIISVIVFTYLFFNSTVRPFNHFMLLLALLATIYSTYINIKIFYKEKN